MSATICKICGLPIFHGAAGYAGPQCTCSFQYKPNYDHNALADLLKARDTLRKQLDEARELLTVASEIIHEQCLHIDSPMTDLGSEALTRLDDWLEANP